LELTLGQLGFGSAFDLRIDGVTFAFGLIVAAPAAVLLTLQPRAWPEAALSMLALTAAMASLEAGGVVLTAIAGGTAATLAIIMLDTEEPRATRPSWALLLAGWLGLTWVGVILQIGGGTAVYTAVPVGAARARKRRYLVGSFLVRSSPASADSRSPRSRSALRWAWSPGSSCWPRLPRWSRAWRCCPTAQDSRRS